MTAPSSDNIDLDQIFQLARRTAIEAGRMLADERPETFSIEKKGRTNLVTEMDLRSEQMIVESIQQRFPDHQILAEEKGIRGPASPVRWIIDPLDGTTNYAHDYRFFCVSIGVEVRGCVEVGVVYDPIMDECFSARRGQGALVNDRSIEVSSVSRLVDALVATGFSYQDREVEENLALFERVTPRVRAVRRDGAAALDLCYVACGRFDAFWELSLNSWDVAAGILIAQEAGGKVTRVDGSACGLDDRRFLASNGSIHRRMVACLGPSKIA